MDFFDPAKSFQRKMQELVVYDGNLALNFVLDKKL